MTIVEVVRSADYAYAFTSPASPVYVRLLPKLRPRSFSDPSFRPNFLRTTSQRMSLLAVSRRAAWRAAPRSTRSVVVDAAPKDWSAKREAVIHHAKGAPCPPASPEVEDLPNLPPDTTDLWRKISVYGCLPASKRRPTRGKNKFELTRTTQSWLATSGCRKLRVNTLSTRNTSRPRTMATSLSLPTMIISTFVLNPSLGGRTRSSTTPTCVLIPLIVFATLID